MTEAQHSVLGGIVIKADLIILNFFRYLLGGIVFWRILRQEEHPNTFTIEPYKIPDRLRVMETCAIEQQHKGPAPLLKNVFKKFDIGIRVDPSGGHIIFQSAIFGDERKHIEFSGVAPTQ